MDAKARASAAAMRALITNGGPAPREVFEALVSLPLLERDAWLDEVLGLDGVPDDGPALPRDGVPYLPCPVDALLRVVERASIGPGDVVIDVGAGVGRAAVALELLTGAEVIGVEIQPELVRAARELSSHLGRGRVSFVEGDACEAEALTRGTVFFLYCPFSGERLERLLDTLEPVARTRTLTLCCVDLPLPARAWLTPLAAGGAVTISVSR